MDVIPHPMHTPNFVVRYANNIGKYVLEFQNERLELAVSIHMDGHEIGRLLDTLTNAVFTPDNGHPHTAFTGSGSPPTR